MTPTDSSYRDRLKAIRERVRELRTERAQAKKERDEAKETAAPFVGDVKEKRKLTEIPEFLALEKTVERLGNIDDEINVLTDEERSLLSVLGDDDNGGRSHGAPPNGSGAVSRPFDGHALLSSSEAYQTARERGWFSSNARFGTVQLGQICSRENFTQFLAQLPAAAPGPITTSTASGAVVPDIRGILPAILKPLSLLDLIPTGTTDSNVIEYVRVIGIPLSAAETAPLETKPEAGLETEDATAPVRTVAQFIKAARQQLDDVAGLASMIQSLLPYGVRRRLETQVLNGDGAGQNLRGILQTTGVTELAHVAEDNVADSILRALTTVVLHDQEPNFVALNPNTMQAMRIMKASTSGVYLYGAPGEVVPPTVWGMAMTQDRTVNEEKPLVGDARACMLLVREGVNVKTSDSDQDDFVRNSVTVLAETRVAFPVWRPSGFVVAKTK